MKKKSFSMTELISLENIKFMAIHPEGRQIAYVKNITNWNENQYCHSLWLYDADQKKHLQILNDSQILINNLQWSPSGDWLAYLATPIDNELSWQLYVMHKNTLTIKKISNFSCSINKFIWDREGIGFFIVKGSPSKQKLKDRHKNYGEFSISSEEWEFTDLCYFKLKEGIAYHSQKYLKSNEGCKDLSDAPLVKNLLLHQKLKIHDLDISGDQKIVFTATTSSKPEFMNQNRVYFYDLNHKNLQRTNITNVDGNIFFSKDSQNVYVCRTQEDYFLNNDLLKIEVQSGNLEVVCTGIDENINIEAISDKGLYFSHDERTDNRIILLTSEGKQDIILSETGGLYNNFSVTPDGEHIAYIKEISQKLAEIYLDQQQITQISNILKGREYAQKKLITWKTEDNYEIEGVLSLPSEFDEKKKYPLLLVVHGGPIWKSYPKLLGGINGGIYLLEAFIQKGFIILEPNYRGSSGYGEKFRSANFRNLGLGDYLDVSGGIDYLIEQGFVDENKIGIMGWSQGGYISAFCTTYSNRFKAVSVGAGISNWQTQFYNTVIPGFEKKYLAALPFEDTNIYQKTSPMHYLQKATTPTLIQHGLKDDSVPIPNAYELYRGLLEIGVETEMIIYHNMQHSPHSPRLKLTIQKQNYFWFCKHLLKEKVQPDYLDYKD